MREEDTSTAYLKSGEVLAAKYRVERVLGEGDIGVVYATQHVTSGRRVAVKVPHAFIASNRGAVTRFLAEARNASSIQSDRVVQVLDVGILHSGLPYMATELLEGLDLKAHEAAGSSLPPVSQAVDWLLETIEAIAHAHAVGIVHGNLKPSNIFLTRKADGTTSIKVLDFGVSTAIEPGGAAAVATLHAGRGSRAYLSPEQLGRPTRVDERSDLWALGVVAYELLSGALPFQSSNGVGPAHEFHRTAPPSPRRVRAEIPAALEAVVLRCLRLEAHERFATAAELGLALAPHGTAQSRRALERVMDVSWASAGGRRVSSSGPAASPAAPSTLPQSVAPWSSGSGWPRGSVPSVPAGPPVVRTRTRAAVLAAALSVAALAAGGYWVARPRSAAVAARPEPSPTGSSSSAPLLPGTPEATSPPRVGLDAAAPVPR